MAGSAETGVSIGQKSHSLRKPTGRSFPGLAEALCVNVIRTIQLAIGVIGSLGMAFSLHEILSMEGGHLFRVSVAESEPQEPSLAAAVHFLNESGHGIVALADIPTIP